MNVRRPKDSRIIVFEELEPFYLELLRRLPEAAEPGDNVSARERLFSAPLTVDNAGFNQDWRDLVEPELQELFRSAHDTVLADLRELPPAGLEVDPACGRLNSAAFLPTKHKLEIPRNHAEAWLGVLNQARLVIAAKRCFGDREMDEDLSFPPASERDLDLFRVHFYDFVQQMLMREMGYE